MELVVGRRRRRLGPSGHVKVWFGGKKKSSSDKKSKKKKSSSSSSDKKKKKSSDKKSKKKEDDEDEKKKNKKKSSSKKDDDDKKKKKKKSSKKKHDSSSSSSDTDSSDDSSDSEKKKSKKKKSEDSKKKSSSKKHSKDKKRKSKSRKDSSSSSSTSSSEDKSSSSDTSSDEKSRRERKKRSSSRHRKRKDSSSSSRSSGSTSDSADEKAIIKEILKSVGQKDIYSKLVKDYDTIKKCKELTHSNLRGLGVDLFTPREKIISAFAEYEVEKKKGSSKKKKDSGKHSSKKRRDSTSSDSSSSRSSRSSESSRSSDSEDDLDVIKEVLRDLDLKKHYRAIVREFDTLSKCQKITHTDLRGLGISTFSERDKIITAFRQYEPPSKSKKKKKKKSSSRSSSRSRSRSRSRRSSRYSSSSSSSSSSYETDSSSEDEEREIENILKNIYMSRHASAILKRFNTIKKCKRITHEDLRNLSVTLYMDREKIIKAFQDYTPSKRSRGKKHRRSYYSSSSSSSSSSFSSDDGDMIKEILRSVGMLKYYYTIYDECSSIQQCKELNHTDLRRLGILLFRDRDAIITAFKNYRSGRRSSYGRGRRGSSSSVGSYRSRGSLYDSEAEEIKDVLDFCGMGQYYPDIIGKFDTVRKCKKMTEKDLIRCGVKVYHQRLAIMEAFQQYKPKKQRRSFIGRILHG